MADDRASSRQSTVVIGPAKLAGAAVNVLVWPATLLWLSSDWRWREGWIFGLWFVAFCVATVAWLYRKDPALLAERYRRPGTGGQSRSDAMLLYAVMVGWILWIVVPALDHRFGLSPRFPAWLRAVGVALLLGASFFLFRAFRDNTFLSPLVRIQSERQHRLVSEGVYRIVRHPMYLGAALMFVGAPLLLASGWGLVVGLGLTALIVFRIGSEERFLARELEGYDTYRSKVRYRLLPLIW